MRTIARLFFLLLIITASPISHGDEAKITKAINQIPPALSIRDGHEILSEGYCDQPYVVQLSDGTWLCTMTTGSAHAGLAGQHIVSTRSHDWGRTGT